LKQILSPKGAKSLLNKDALNFADNLTSLAIRAKKLHQKRTSTVKKNHNINNLNSGVINKNSSSLLTRISKESIIL